MHKFIQALALFTLFVSSANAARPMITDDARVVDRHSCQLETWGVISKDISEYWAIPGCNLIFDIEMSVGAMFSNSPPDSSDKSKFGGRQFIIGAKRVFSDLENDGYALGVALGNAYNFKRSKYRHDHYIYMPFSLAFFDNALLLHSNVGYKLYRNLDNKHIYNLGLGLEQQINAPLWVLGEIFYERFDRLKYQLGLRIWLVQDKIQLDATYGNAFSGRDGFVSIGLRFLGPQMF